MILKESTFFFSLGANAYFKLKQFQEAIIWCDKGLTVSFLRIMHAAPRTTIIFFTLNMSRSTLFYLSVNKQFESIKSIKISDLRAAIA